MAGERYRCSACGGDLVFQPGQPGLVCPHCGASQAIGDSDGEVREQDFRAAVAAAAQAEPTLERREVTCNGCGARVTLDAGVQSDRCPYCATQLAAAANPVQLLQPRALLPFALKRPQAQRLFHRWLRSRWFAPSSLRHMAGWEGALQGVYVPYWTYDAHTVTQYTGARGEDYWVTESYTTVVNGKTVHRTRQVRRTRWYPAAGVVENRFDDILVLASRSLPTAQADLLEPWNLVALVPYDERYLQGFRVESYQLGLEEGFGVAANRMQPQIRETVCHDIGGDHQRVHSMDVAYPEITFKHILLPVWVSSYRHRNRLYRIMVNAITGEVQGERPYSVVKILLAVLGGLAAALLAAGLVMQFAGAR